jgi:hypothetical protein
MKMLVRRDGFVAEGQQPAWASPVSAVAVWQALGGAVVLIASEAWLQVVVVVR